ncbi:hypothetical protein BDQ17DRAFT_1171965, partial [Cyathus striatus]
TKGTVSVFSLIVMAMCAHLISFTISLDNIYFNFSALGLATALLTMLTVPAMIIVDMSRKGAFTSMIAVELGWIGFLWVMWLATAALTADNNITGGSCGRQLFSAFVTACGEINAIEAFAFLNWLALVGYFALLLAYSIVANNNGNEGVWMSSVKYTDFGAAATNQPTGEKIAQANYQSPNTTGTPVPTYPPQQP